MNAIELPAAPSVVVLDHEGERILAGGYDEAWLIARTGEPLGAFELGGPDPAPRRGKRRRHQEHSGLVKLAAFSPEGRHGLVCTGHHSGGLGSNAVLLLTLDGTQAARVLEPPPPPVRPHDMLAATFSRDGARVAALDDQGLWIWGSHASTPASFIALPRVDRRLVLLEERCALAFEPSGERVLAVLDDHVVRFDARGTSATIATGAQVDALLLGVASYDEERRALVCIGGARRRAPSEPFRILHLDPDAAPVGFEEGPRLPATPAWLSPDGRRVIGVASPPLDRDEPKRLVSVDLATGAMSARHVDSSAQVLDASADGGRLLIVSRDGYRVLDVAELPLEP